MNGAAQVVESDEEDFSSRKDPISHDLEFMADLAGLTTGTGKVPRDPKQKKKHLRGLRHHLMKTRDLTEAVLNRQISIYSRVNGPATIRSIWAGRLKMEDVMNGEGNTIILAKH